MFEYLAPSLWNCLGRIKKFDLVGGGVVLLEEVCRFGLGFAQKLKPGLVAVFTSDVELSAPSLAP